MNITSKHRWVVCRLYAAGILGASIMPSAVLAATPEFFPHQDKVLHAVMYGGWAALLGWASQERFRRNALVCGLGIVAIAMAYGVLMELLQGILGGSQRTCSWGDILANLIGAVAGTGWMAWRRSS